MIYVMSDIHGRYDRYISVMRKVRLRKTDTLYILGDVIDRNPDGLKLLQYIMKKENVKLLLGNHEHMLLDALYYHPYPPKPSWRDDELKRWYHNGGYITHKKWKGMRKEKREEIINYLLSLPVNVEVEVKGKQYLLVHGQPLKKSRNGAKGEQEAIYKSVWSRYEVGATGPTDKTVVFGHTPTYYYDLGGEGELAVWHGENLIGIDCGCAYEYGRLGVICLNTMREFYSEDEVATPEKKAATTDN